MRTVDKLLGFAEHACLILANLCLAAILVGNLANITSRVVVGRDLVFVFPWSTVLFVWSVFLGAYVAYRRGRDLRVLFLVERFNARAQSTVSVIGGAVVLAVLAAILWQAPRLLAAQQNLIEIVGLPRYMLSVPLFVATGLMAIGVLREMAAALATERR